MTQSTADQAPFEKNFLGEICPRRLFQLMFRIEPEFFLHFSCKTEAQKITSDLLPPDVFALEPRQHKFRLKTAIGWNS